MSQAAVPLGLIVGLLACSATLADEGPSTPCPRPGAVPVYTSAGVLCGQRQRQRREWLGVPYAQPPLGNLRWRPPVPKEPWSARGPWDATAYGADCAQLGPAWPSLGSLNNSHSLGATSEDCLYLNVFAPTSAPAPPRNHSHRRLDEGPALLPVVVFIPAGAFQWGSGHDRENDGSAVGAPTRDGWSQTVLVSASAPRPLFCPWSGGNVNLPVR
jgi:para-nitrobenzyl esterase